MQADIFLATVALCHEATAIEVMNVELMQIKTVMCSKGKHITGATLTMGKGGMAGLVHFTKTHHHYH